MIRIPYGKGCSQQLSISPGSQTPLSGMPTSRSESLSGPQRAVNSESGPFRLGTLIVAAVDVTIRVYSSTAGFCL